MQPHLRKARMASGQCFSLLLSLSILSITTSSDTSCGGRLTAPKGVIHTPDFPNAFTVPIKCRWVIDVSDIPSTNSSIVVYLTQIYAYKGLKFTEYAYYESDTMNFGASLVKEVTEGNIFEYKWLRTFRPFLVLEFELDRLEGNHVRVLNDLLDVYGFNVTYQMTEDDVNPNSCSVSDCSYTGNCLVSTDYTTFTCECFTGFSGMYCNEGPLCFVEQQGPVCENDGVCKQIGAEAMHCSCPPGFVGQMCGVQLLDARDTECGIENCMLQCPFVSKEDRPCSCKNGIKIYNNRSRYECRIKLSNITLLRNGLITSHSSLESFVGKQLAKYLRNSNITSTEDLKILSVTPTSEVTFHFFGNSDDGDKIRESLNRLVQRRRFGEITLESTHFTFQQKPALKLQNLRINRINEHEVHIGDQLILSCVAQGSYGINFTWYKDNMLINTGRATRSIWYKQLPNDGSDVHTSLLTIEKITLLDEGQYTCQVAEWSVQQCKSIYVEVRDEPDVKVIPMSATVDKGSNVQLTCMTPNMRNIGIGFGWTKNKALLKLEPGSEVWEDLYPAGSILKITNAQKSAIYTCNVAHRAMSVRVEVVNRTLIPICLKEKSWGLQWPDTAPGSEALLECPRYFLGHRVSRLCAMTDATTPEWQTPDFSSCLYSPLVKPYNRFRSLTLGYGNATAAETIISFWEILQTRKLPLHPGEGDRIVNILTEIERYYYHVEGAIDPYDSTEALTRIVNRVLNNESAILNQQTLVVLLDLLQLTFVHWSKDVNNISKHLSLSSMVVDIQHLQSQHSGDGVTHSLQIPADNYTYPTWYNDKVAIRLWKKRQRNLKSNGTFVGIVVVYKNISRFLPTAYMKELDDGTDLEYHINSRIVTVIVPSFGADKHSKIWVDVQMKLLHNQSTPWNISCGLMNGIDSWDLTSCITNTLPGDISTHCLCPTTGTIAVFLAARAVRVVLAKKEQTTFIVLFGCGSCLAQCLLSSVILGSFWWKNRTWLNFLKLQCCGALVGAMATFVYAVQTDLPEASFSLIAITLEAFLLVGMSAPISEALIIYAELTHVRPSQHLQPTVIAVITGVPILAVLATELTQKSTGWRHESWWLIYGNGVYNIFVTCATMMFLIFMVLYMGAIHKAHALVQKNVMKKEMIETRIQMLHRAAIIICGIVAMEASSILYINSMSIIFHYIFASLSSTLGFLIIIVYILSGENAFIRTMVRKLGWKTERSENVSEPVKVCSKSKGEMENDTTTPPQLASAGESYMEVRGMAVGSIDIREFITESTSPYSKSSVPATSRFLSDIRIDRTDNINLENYSTSPRKYQENISFDSTFSGRNTHCVTENLNVKDCCTFRDFGKYHESQGQVFMSQNVAPAECSAKMLCNADVESRLSTMPDVTLAVNNDVELLTMELKTREHVNVIPDIANTTERKQPDGEENTPEITITKCETTTGMLDRISHDLDYLLNRTHAKEGS